MQMLQHISGVQIIFKPTDTFFLNPNSSSTDLGVIVILGGSKTLETVTFRTGSHPATGLVVGRSGVSSTFV